MSLSPPATRNRWILFWNLRLFIASPHTLPKQPLTLFFCMTVFRVYQEMITPVEIMLIRVMLCEERPILKSAKYFENGSKHHYSPKLRLVLCEEREAMLVLEMAELAHSWEE